MESLHKMTVLLESVVMWARGDDAQWHGVLVHLEHQGGFAVCHKVLWHNGVIYQTVRLVHGQSLLLCDIRIVGVTLGKVYETHSQGC